MAPHLNSVEWSPPWGFPPVSMPSGQEELQRKALLGDDATRDNQARERDGRGTPPAWQRWH